MSTRLACYLYKASSRVEEERVMGEQNSKSGKINKRLRTWYAKNARGLPWRRTRTLYRTVVSEFMLQQTQVTTVLPYFDRWVQAFPDFETLAAASEEQVLKHWEGLGYYRRARNLHKLARELISFSEIPSCYDAWLKLSGIGPYTAAAISSISFNEPRAVVDGNVVRVLSRVHGIESKFKDGAEAVKSITPYADKALDTKHPGEHNEAIMELGATVCLRSNPQCKRCPLQTLCVAKQKDITTSLPRIAKRKTIKREIDRAWVESNDRLLLYRTTSERLANVHELPELSSLVLQKNRRQTPMLTKNRAIANERISESIYKRKLTDKLCKQVNEDTAYVWVDFDQLDDITLSGPHRRWIETLARSRRSEARIQKSEVSNQP